MHEMLEMRETFEALSIIRLKRFKPQTFQASSFKTDPDFHQDDTFARACPEFNSGMTVLSE